MAVLVALSYSPWSEKARWALDHHQVPYEEEHYLPMIGEPGLRLRLKKPFGRVTVPVFFDGSRAITDSLEIARYAERSGEGSKLFPAQQLGAIERWNDRSEEALQAGRGLVVARTAVSPPAKREALPPFIPEAVRPLLGGVADLGVRFFLLKYQPSQDERAAEAVIAGVLEELREALKGRTYLVGDAFSFADIAMCAVLQIVRPVDDRYLRIGEATRVCWTTPSLAVRFPDLLKWRDELYARHRR